MVIFLLVELLVILMFLFLFPLMTWQSKFVKPCSMVDNTVGSFCPRGFTSAKNFPSKVEKLQAIFIAFIFRDPKGIWGIKKDTQVRNKKIIIIINWYKLAIPHCYWPDVILLQLTFMIKTAHGVFRCLESNVNPNILNLIYYIINFL